ncbi:MAG: hypothetical protein HOP13_07410 [Alphaproteobacteria bacterium]|nr:hypothetical protein [Alphaproteobacteria bacterium]
MPISAPQMRGAPELVLSYDSGSGNGPFGLGWSLSSASISLKTDRGLPLYEKSDIFIMSSAEDLQRKLLYAPPAGSGQAASWTVDEHTDGGYRVTRYRPRTEGDFNRIELRVSLTDPAQSWWLAVSKDNVRSFFGRYPSGAYPDNSATIADPKSPYRIFSWLLTEVVQPNGARSLFEYKTEDNANVRNDPAEDLRRLTPQPQKYLKRVYYGNPPVGAKTSAWACTLVFDYGEHDAQNPDIADSAPWEHRPDSFSRCRSRFEVRTRRLCKRILCFQDFESLGPSPVLTRSTEFTYDLDPVGSRLVKVTHKGFAQEGGALVELSAPPITFDYSTVKPADAMQFIKGESARNVPQGVTTPYSFADIDGEGLPGVLSEYADGWRYKRNLGNGEFGGLEVLAKRPAWASFGNGSRVAAIESDGQPYVVAYAGPLTGFSARENDGEWAPFRPFEKNAVVDFNASDVRHIDLDGDGKVDIAILRDDEIVWRKNEGKLGYTEEKRAGVGDNELRGPRRVFLNNLESIFTTDMTGDGLEDIVRIRNGNVTYWPNLGYGRFGEKVVMNFAPIFDAEDRFSAARIKLGDIDGSGTTDILYVGAEGASYWINQSGNQFGAAKVLPTFPCDDGFSDATLADLLGNGTSCLVWSTALPAHAGAPWRYLDLMGGKPYLLTRVNNGTGAETRLSYKASTYYYLRDRRLGKPWATKLPFPVHVVDRVEAEDLITGNVHVKRYAYHHGYYDRPEREFRGFGCVEEWATEGKASHGAELFHRPPILSRSWYHTGAWSELRKLSTQFKHEYAALQPEYELSDSVIDFTDAEVGDSTAAYSAKELREARRALRGHLLRQEIYQCDDPVDPLEFPTPHANPYTLVEHRYAVRRLQPIAGGNEHAVFLAGELEALTRHYEEQPDDARITQELTLKSNDYGEKLRAASIAYPREPAANGVIPEQLRTRISVNETDFIDTDSGETDFSENAWRRIGALKAARGWELETGPPGGALYNIATLNAAFDSATTVDPSDVPEYAAALPANASRKRLLKASVRLYRAAANAAALDFTPLDFGTIDGLALPGRDFSLIFSRRMLENAGLRAQGDDDATSKVKLQDLKTNGYVPYADLTSAPELSGLAQFQTALSAVESAAAGSWWVQDGVAAYDPALFYLVTTARDPWGAVTSVVHDALGVLPLSVTDALGSTGTVDNDYRVLAPVKVTDPNGNVQEATFDALGRPVKIAISGTDETGAAVGDTLASPTQIFEYHDHEAEDPANPKPNYAHAWSRHTHFHDLDAATQALQPLAQGVWSEARAYADGFGRELETKRRGRPGTAYQADGTKTAAVAVAADPRWVGTGRTLYDNQGDPVRKYEPYFSTTADYEEEDVLRLWGVSPIVHYDPLGRAVRTDFPDGSYSKVEFSPWHETTWDQNDTASLTDPNTGVATKSDWFTSRGTPDPTTAPPSAADQYAAWIAAAHADTPAEKRLDTLGRPVRTIESNATLKDDPNDPLNGPKSIAKATYESRSVLDIAGNALEIWDANNNCALKQVFDLAGRPLHTISNDAGKRWLLAAADGQPAIVIGERGFRTETEHDLLQRPTKSWVSDASSKRLANEIVYGETALNAQDYCLRGQIWKSRDQAGEFVNYAFGLKGEAKKTGRRLPADQTTEPDWSASPALDSEEFIIEYKVDAEGRNVWERAPDGSELTFVYDIGGHFIASTAKHATQSAASAIVSDIEYDAKEQRTRLTYGNGAVTTYDHDPKTFRLARLQTSTGVGTIQDIQYTYDAAGNIVEIEDRAQPTVFTSNQMVTPTRRFRYDALYRLIRAEGREHQAVSVPPNLGLSQRFPVAAQAGAPPPQLADGTKLQNYIQTYEYDTIGNIKAMRHSPSVTAAGWTRTYTYDYESGGPSNRLASTVMAGDPLSPVSHSHDAHGNMLALPHLGTGGLTWDHADRLHEAALPTAGQRELYAYDGSGERVLKRTAKGAIVELRIYLSRFFEIYRVLDAAGAKSHERTTLHVIDGESRVTMMETATLKSGVAPAQPSPVLRYEIGDHLGSAQIELTDSAQLLTYEEFHPYGTTAIYVETGGAGDYSTKRYRYTGNEREEATGLNYHSARYFLPWLARWLSADPAGGIDGPNLFVFARMNPIGAVDNSGQQATYMSAKPGTQPLTGSQPEPYRPDPKLIKRLEESEKKRVEYSKALGAAMYQFFQNEGRNLFLSDPAMHWKATQMTLTDMTNETYRYFDDVGKASADNSLLNATVFVHETGETLSDLKISEFDINKKLSVGAAIDILTLLGSIGALSQETSKEEQKLAENLALESLGGLALEGVGVLLETLTRVSGIGTALGLLFESTETGRGADPPKPIPGFAGSLVKSYLAIVEDRAKQMEMYRSPDNFVAEPDALKLDLPTRSHW